MREGEAEETGNIWLLFLERMSISSEKEQACAINVHGSKLSKEKIH